MDTEGLSIICAGLGIAEEDENGNRVGYSKGEYCLDNLKDLLRFLRRDDPQTRDVFKQVCKWNTVSKDLIPIIEHCQDDYNLVLNAVKVLVFLTMPIERTSNDISQQIEYLWQLKSSITCSDVVAVIVSLLESPLESLECETFTEDDWKLVQLVLTLFRNVLAIQEISLQQKSGGSANQFLFLRDRFLELLFRENLMDLILVITQHIDGSCGFLHHDNFLLLEIFHYIFMGQEPELVANVHLKGFKVDEDTKSSVGSLKSIMEKEEEKRRLSRLWNMVRHSQFSGTFTRLTMDGSKAVLKGNPTSASLDILLKHHNVPRGPIKRIAWDIGRLASTKDKILELLHDFVSQFLLGAYNVLMQSIREDIEKEHHAVQNSDVIMFFQVAQFVTSYQYHKLLKSKPNVGSDNFEAFVDKDADSTIFGGDICGPITQSMNESMFQLVILKWRSAFEGLKETNNYKFLSAAGSLMKTMICMLDLVLKLLPEESKEPRTARILLYKLFYDQTDQGITQFLLNLIRMFDTHKQPKSDLADLIEIIHKIVRLMENLQAHGTLRVARKSRRKRKKSLSNKETDNEQLGDCVTIQNEFGISNNEQSADMSICQQGSRTSTNTNGKENIVIPAPVDEPEMSVSQTRKLTGSLPEMGNKGADQANDDLCYGTDDSSGEEQLDATDEVDFNLSTLISAFANNNIIHRLCWLLKFYKSNSASTNHYIICLLRRITEDLELSPMLYQISILTIFHNILVEQKSCPSKEYENLIDFLKSLVRRMLRKMKIQPLLFVEALFWKTRKECHFINAEYLVHEIGSLKKGGKNWDNVPGDGEIGSSQANRWNVRSIADALGEDEADVVISHELGYQSMEENSDKAGGIKENPDNMSQSMEHESESAPRRKRRPLLGAEMEGKIKDLYEKFKDDQHCSRLIAEVIDPDGDVSPAQVSNKLRKLGLKVAPRKKMLYVDEHDRERKVVERPHESDVLEGSSLSRTLHSRKRIRAFSEDDEGMIRALYEKFKEHKRCSYMIAKALDSDGKFTAVQVSHKLKQLGLCVPRHKTSEANKHLKDENINDSFRDASHDSDDETLLSLMNRKAKRSLPQSKHESVTAISIQRTSLGDSGNEASEVDIEWDGSDHGKKLEPAGIDVDVAFSQDSLNGSAEAEVTRSGSGKLRVVAAVNNLDHFSGQQRDDELTVSEDNVALIASPKRSLRRKIGRNGSIGVAPDNLDHLSHQQMDDELADSGDEVAPSVSPKDAVTRRMLRVVLDLEDD
ncbi:protein timeless homolog [Carya illinoinensis]|uniref:protein timeless homolog n=1 Tax=Carya illinoinensis TaxID=32201 RepID=UPI001C71E67F|nr:protein timeless homolog [Carya illinoinensis]